MVPQAVSERLREQARVRGIASDKNIALLAGIDTGDPYFAVRVGELLDDVSGEHRRHTSSQHAGHTLAKPATDSRRRPLTTPRRPSWTDRLSGGCGSGCG